MSKVALIDADMVAYRCAASAEEDPLEIALERADSLVDRIIMDIGASVAELYLTGSNNFRYDINPQYKAQRTDKPRPKWLQDVREHLVIGWGARVTDGNEADDELGICQCTGNGDTVIVTNDKDLLMIPGEHYNPISLVKRTISPHEGLQNFYFQMIMGDSSDNILGFDYKARSKVPKFLEPIISKLMELQTEQEMHEFVCDLYSEHAYSWADDWYKRYEMNAHCLWIQRKVGDKWQSPNENNQDLNQD